MSYQARKLDPHDDGIAMTKYATVGTSTTSPTEQTQRKEVIVATGISNRPSKTRSKIVALYVGGAADKRAFPIPLPYKLLGPHGNALDIRRRVDTQIRTLQLEQWYSSEYIGYYEIYGDERIQKNVIAKISDNASPIVIVGHSLGGWNGAHLSGWLNAAGYRVQMLVTLDPVGEDGYLAAAADIYAGTPKVAARHWINIRAETKKSKTVSDYVADVGGQWNVTRGPHINVVVDAYHASAERMFCLPVDGTRTAEDYLFEFIRKWTGS